MQTKKRLSMIQSPRGQLNVTAPIGFSIETVENYMNPDPNVTSLQTQDTNNIDSLDQLVWSNPIQTNLHPQILRQLEFSDNLLHMAQSAKTPLGVNPFWEQGATPPIEWKQWLSTLKMAILARDSIEVDKLLKLKPQPTDLFYPTLPTYEAEFEGETEDEARNREQRNERRRVDFENECKVIERKGAMVDRIPWDEADTKVKSLIYLSLGAEARRTYHQKNPHTQIEKWTTNELVHELNIIFTIPRNTTFDRFKFFKSMHQTHESLETFYSRIREAGAMCKFKDLEEDLVKDLFISNMTNTSIQMDLLSEVKTPQQVLNFAINRERGQTNQQEILRAHSSSTNWSNVSYIRNNTRQQQQQQQQRRFKQPILPTPPTGKIQPCFKCGQAFIRYHLNKCKAQNFTCQIYKKTGHYTSMCKAPMPERKKPTTPRQENRYTPQNQPQNTRRVRHIQEDQEQESPEEESETVDGEAALYIKELMEDLSAINIVRPTGFKEVNNVSLNKDTSGEFWVKTNFRKSEIDWLADTGSPRSFVQESIAKDLIAKHQDASISKFTEKTK